MEERASKEFAQEIAKILDDKKGRDILLIDVQKMASYTDYFVICSGTSSTHIKALADETYDRLKEKGVEPMSLSGYDSASWILMDYGAVFVHIFSTEDRDFYKLERLWSDAEFVRFG